MDQRTPARWIFASAVTLAFASGCAEGGDGPPGSGGGATGSTSNAGGGTSTSTATGTSTSTSTATGTTTSTGGVQCGDTMCDAPETCSTCPADCGTCCGNSTCDIGENCTSCVADCPSCSMCGNGACETGEDATSCAQDCDQMTDTCDHDPCDEGGALTLDCSPCAAFVCFSDPTCCFLDWGSGCVAIAESQPMFCGC